MYTYLTATVICTPTYGNCDTRFLCLRAILKDLKVQSDYGEWNEIHDFRGNYPVIKEEKLPGGHYVISDLLYVVENVQDTSEQTQQIGLDAESIQFDMVCDEIFADG